MQNLIAIHRQTKPPFFCSAHTYVGKKPHGLYRLWQYTEKTETGEQRGRLHTYHYVYCTCKTHYEALSELMSATD